MSSKKRGRPKKDPEKRRARYDKVKVEPSRKKILRQEAERCGKAMGEIFRKNAFEEIEPQERPMPDPNVIGWILRISGKLKEKAETLDAEWLLDELSELGSELTIKAAEVQQRRVRREKWRTEAKEEKMDGQITFRLTGAEAEWLEKVDKRTDRPLRTILREAAFKGIRKREQMEEIEKRLTGWAEIANDLWEEEEGEDGAPQNEMRVRRAMRRLVVKMARFLEEETN